MENERVKALEKLCVSLMAEIEAHQMMLAVLIRAHPDRQKLRAKWTASTPEFVDYAMKKPHFRLPNYPELLTKALGKMTDHIEHDL